jgi:hypothetical protein
MERWKEWLRGECASLSAGECTAKRLEAARERRRHEAEKKHRRDVRRYRGGAREEIDRCVGNAWTECWVAEVPADTATATWSAAVDGLLHELRTDGYNCKVGVTTRYDSWVDREFSADGIVCDLSAPISRPDS